MPKHVPLIAATSFALAALAGCGQAPNQDASPTQGPPPAAKGTPSSKKASPRPQSASTATNTDALTKAEFIARADAICERMTAESVAVAAKHETLSSEELGKRALELQGRAIKQLRALRPPAGDERRVGAVLLHLERLQLATRALFDDDGEDTLPAVAAIAFETDAVARAAKRYGLFRDCGAYRESPELQRIMREAEEKPKSESNVEPPWPDVIPTRLRRAAAALVPPNRRVVEKRPCGEGDRTPPPVCVIVELAPGEKAVPARKAEFARVASRRGWEVVEPSGERPNPGVLLLRRAGFEATVWLTTPQCTVRLAPGPGEGVSLPSGCVDSIELVVF